MTSRFESRVRDVPRMTKSEGDMLTVIFPYKRLVFDLAFANAF